MNLQFPSDFASVLKEMKALRNVLVHRGAIADRSYCRTTGRQDLFGTRLDVSEAYLDKSQAFVMELVFTLIDQSKERLATKEKRHER